MSCLIQKKMGIFEASQLDLISTNVPVLLNVSKSKKWSNQKIVRALRILDVFNEKKNNLPFLANTIVLLFTTKVVTNYEGPKSQ